MLLETSVKEDFTVLVIF